MKDSKMSNNKFNTKNLNSILLMGASVLVLSACVPEDETASRDADVKRIESMAKSYSQAFEHYSNQALNAVVNSTAWQAQILPEGPIDLSDVQFGELNLGQAESYLQSAHCNISGDSYHLTWFDQADGDGDLFLKGLGAKQSGLVSLKIKDIIPDNNFGIMGASSIEMSDGATTLSLSGACSTINIPQGSAVAAIRIPAPVEVSEIQEKHITRSMPCGADEEGGILQRITAQFTSTGSIMVQGREFNSESSVIDDNSLTWNEISNQCIALSESVTRVVQANSADAVDMASLSGVSGGIANTLRSNLRNLECKDSQDPDENLTDEEREEANFNTCEDAGDLDLLDSMSAEELRLLREEENVIITACPAQGDMAGTVTVDTSHDDFTGVHNALDGKQGALSFGEMTGEITLKKISRFYEIINDYGGETGQQSDEIKSISYTGKDIQCSRSNALYITCDEIFPNIKNDIERNTKSYGWIENIGLTYTRQASIDGWADTETLSPNDMQYNGIWSTNGTIQCTYQIQKTIPIGNCGTIISTRNFTSSTITNGAWEEWNEHPPLAINTSLSYTPNPAYHEWIAEYNLLIAAVELDKIEDHLKNQPSTMILGCIEHDKGVDGPGDGAP